MYSQWQQDNAFLQILNIATSISSSNDLPGLLGLILQAARRLTSADAGSIFLIEKHDFSSGRAATGFSDKPEGQSDRLWFAASQNASLEPATDPAINQPSLDETQACNRFSSQLHEIRIPVSADCLAGWTVANGSALNIADAYQLDPALPYHFDQTVDRILGYQSVSILSVPMRSASGEIIGVLQVINRKRDATLRLSADNLREQVCPFDHSDQALIEALASLAAVCVQRTQLVEAQDRLIDAFVSLLAGAIDAKSPHTGGHCARVPELALLLAQAAEATTDGPLADFSLGSDQAWREFRIGAWLHDCGKVTTPEYVVDKATKLEAQVNRIHEIRTRFEVLLRDARIQRLEGLLAGGDPGELDRRLAEREAELHDQFALVASSNLGREAFSADKIKQLRAIAAQTWQRHFDDSLGLAWEEHQRRTAHGPAGAAVPATETLLADKPWHRVPRREQDLPDERYGFCMDVPVDFLNHGELYNLCVSRGTLTEEERHIIKDHIVQTVVMLEQLPFPPALARVPEYAGTHHETLNGDGYPRMLRADQLSVPSRIMAIADIFEALTAPDRPYKKAKTLSESITILAGFRDRGHIDSHIFELFLTSGVYKIYAERFLDPSQIDDFDINFFLRNK